MLETVENVWGNEEDIENTFFGNKLIYRNM